MFKLPTFWYVLVFVLMADVVSAQGQLFCVPPDGLANQSGVVSALYFDSVPQDQPDCGMRVVNGRITFDAKVTNPSMTCPDRFAWKMFVEAISNNFWTNWASDNSTFPGCNGGSVACDGSSPEKRPGAPLPLCGPGGDPAACCNPDSRTNPGYNNNWNPAISCPNFPGDHPGVKAPHIAQAPSKAHALAAPVPATAGLANAFDKGRVIRQAAAEIVFRNRAQWDYTFRNNLYNQEGLAKVFANANANLAGNLPYRNLDTPGNLFEIRFPVDAVSIKSNWISRQFALDQKVDDDPPHIKMTVRSPVNLNSINDFNGVTLQPGEYWLMAMHITSKDIPDWTWATFEHVDNPGRCDFIGCNDSFGYQAADKNILATQYRNYTAPFIKSDNLCVASWVFDRGRIYPSGPASSGLAAILNALQIGTGRSSVPPTAADPGWRSYRLKGSLNSFSDKMGHPRRVGNSVTEGGFVSTSGCMTCHSRASIGPKGSIPPPVSIFTNTLSEVGYSQALMGTPNPNWFLSENQPPQYNAFPADFVWGILSARCVNPSFNPIACFLTPPKPAR